LPLTRQKLSIWGGGLLRDADSSAAASRKPTVVGARIKICACGETFTMEFGVHTDT
jgi:hypothetical protein